MTRSVLAYGDRALLVELGSTDRVTAWTAALSSATLPGVLDLVPAAETLLVVTDRTCDVPQLRQRLLCLDEPPPLGTSREGGEVVEVPVRYDGPDLSDVAELTGLSVREVVAAHTGSPWRVAFGGFAPGFAYLVGGDERLRVPRRASSRTTVPAGSVGLAGEFSGVYPRASPGGWQLIGTTDLPMWDLERDPPALLRPGVEVRFVEDR
jgi:KipI family sensor histidine kinase inhibitor